MKAARTTTLVPWLLLAVIALIAYGSLYPFNFKRDAIEGGIIEALQQLSWVRAGRGDRVSNVLLYIPLGFCLFLWFDSGRRRWLTAIGVVALGAALSLLIEVAQVFISPRVPSLADLTLNAVGTLVGAAAGFVWRTLSRLIQMPTVGSNRGDRVALMVIVLWLGWRFAPFIPALSLAKLKMALRPLFDPLIDLAATFSFLACWLVVSQALFVLASRQGGLEALLVLIASVLVGQLLLADQVFVPSELLALLLLLPALVIINRLSPPPRRLLLMGAIGLVFIFERLAPFEFAATPGQFDLWPFLGWIDAGMPIDLRALLAFLFFCSSLIWLARESGASFELAIALVVGIVVGIELLQLWQPDRAASITDPLLALATGLLLRAINPAARRSNPGFR